MGLAEVFKNAAQTAIKATGNIPVAITYREEDTSYNPSTGETSTITTSHSLNAIKYRFSDAEMARTGDLAPKEGDFKLLVAANDLGITPKLTDAVAYGGKDHTIVNIKTDPAEAAWILHVRARR